MSKIWDDLKSNVKDWSNAAVEKAEEVSKVAVAKTEEITKLSKIKLAIHQLQRDKGKEFLLLGKLAYNHSKEANMSNFTGNAEFFAHIEKIDALSKQSVEKEKEIEAIKSEATDISDEPVVNDLKENEVILDDQPEEVVDLEEIDSPQENK